MVTREIHNISSAIKVGMDPGIISIGEHPNPFQEWVQNIAARKSFLTDLKDKLLLFPTIETTAVGGKDTVDTTVEQHIPVKYHTIVLPALDPTSTTEIVLLSTQLLLEEEDPYTHDFECIYLRIIPEKLSFIDRLFRSRVPRMQIQMKYVQGSFF